MGSPGRLQTCILARVLATMMGIDLKGTRAERGYHDHPGERGGGSNQGSSHGGVRSGQFQDEV